MNVMMMTVMFDLYVVHNCMKHVYMCRLTARINTKT